MRNLLLTLVVAGTFAGASRADAAPTVIRDEMLQGATGAAVLGQGYSIATNELAGSCLTNVVPTKPSYNFELIVFPLDEAGLERLAGRGRRMSSVAAELGRRFPAGAGAGPVHTHRLIVVIQVDAYHNSIDESLSRLSEPAAALLTKNDLVGFFETCGVYHVRSINRQMAMVGVISYETASKVPDPAHVQWVTQQLRGFTNTTTGTTDCDATCRAGVTLRTMELHLLLDRAPATVETKMFDQQAFKAAVQRAFMASQPEGAGYATSIEVVPWLHHPDVQNLVRLSPREVLDGDAKPMIVTSYEQKRTLTVNAELLFEIRRVGRAKREAFETAQRCKAIKYGERERIRLEHETFASGAHACVAEMTAAGPMLRSYRTLPACVELEQSFAVVAGLRAHELCASRR
jgi:hypothetical protein